MAGESRTELIAWLNELLQINYTKVEQCGTGAAYCQVIDSIFGDVPMGKVKMASRQEYEYLANFKVLQNTFKSHGIDKPIPVDRLVKCKMQDNLEFLQWLKKYWDLNFPGGDYDPVARRKGGSIAAPDVGGSSARATARSPAPPAARAASAAKRSTAAPARTSGPRSASAAPDAALQALTAQMNEMKVAADGLSYEREFYFGKLREIEILIAARLESGDEGITTEEKDLLLQIQGILYSTEEGFEVPDGQADEEETF